MTTEKQYTKAEAYEYLIEGGPLKRLYYREGDDWHSLSYASGIFAHCQYSIQSRLTLRYISFDGPFYETPDPLKAGPEYELPECLRAEALNVLRSRMIIPRSHDDEEFARRILIQARKDTAEMIAEAMLAKGADEPNGG